ncbi:hypothetical protein VYU27_009557 [Nannochloropsis oceanica]
MLRSTVASLRCLPTVSSSLPAIASVLLSSSLTHTSLTACSSNTSTRRRQRQLHFAYHSTALCPKDIKMTWHVAGEEIPVTAAEGKSLLEVAHENDIELEGACGGELACSTCHVVFTPELYGKLPEKKEEEEDMLDLAWGLTDTSRLGCQIKVSPVLENAVITIPEETNNMLGGEEGETAKPAGAPVDPWAK